MSRHLDGQENLKFPAPGAGEGENFFLKRDGNRRMVRMLKAMPANGPRISLGALAGMKYIGDQVASLSPRRDGPGLDSA